MRKMPSSEKHRRLLESSPSWKVQALLAQSLLLKASLVLWNRVNMYRVSSVPVTTRNRARGEHLMPEMPENIPEPSRTQIVRNALMYMLSMVVIALLVCGGSNWSIHIKSNQRYCWPKFSAMVISSSMVCGKHRGSRRSLLIFLIRSDRRTGPSSDS